MNRPPSRGAVLSGSEIVKYDHASDEYTSRQWAPMTDTTPMDVLIL